jgi:hypothetical protein
MAKGQIPGDETFDNPWSAEREPTEAAGPSRQTHNEESRIDQNIERDDPPVYSGPSEPARNILAPPTHYSLPGMPNIEFQKYRIPESSLSKDQRTVTTTLSTLISDPTALERFIREQAALPPRPHVCIKGNHATNVDFDIKINMMRYIIHPEDEKWNFIKLSPLPEKKNSKASEAGRDSLAEWTKRFCKDSAIIKT